jgi:hypothetical protein
MCGSLILEALWEKVTRLITSTDCVCRKPPIKLHAMVVISSCRVLLIECMGLGFCFTETQSQQRHHHVGHKWNLCWWRGWLSPRRCPIMCTSVFINLNGCIASASSVPSGIRSMKRMTFALLMPSHVYVYLHLLQQLCPIRLVSAQQQCVWSHCEGTCQWSSHLAS